GLEPWVEVEAEVGAGPEVDQPVAVDGHDVTVEVAVVDAYPGQASLAGTLGISFEQTQQARVNSSVSGSHHTPSVWQTDPDGQTAGRLVGEDPGPQSVAASQRSSFLSTASRPSPLRAGGPFHRPHGRAKRPYWEP